MRTLWFIEGAQPGYNKAKAACAKQRREPRPSNILVFLFLSITAFSVKWHGRDLVCYSLVTMLKTEYFVSPRPIFLCWNLIPNAMVSRDGAFEMIRSWGPMSKYYHIEWEQEIPKKRDSYQRDSRELSYPFYHIRTHTKKLCMNQEVSFHRTYLSAFDLGLPKIRNVFIQK